MLTCIPSHSGNRNPWHHSMHFVLSIRYKSFQFGNFVLFPGCCCCSLPSSPAYLHCMLKHAQCSLADVYKPPRDLNLIGTVLAMLLWHVLGMCRWMNSAGEGNRIRSEQRINLQTYTIIPQCEFVAFHTSPSIWKPRSMTVVQVGWQNNGQHSIRLVTCVDWNGTHPKVCCSHVELSSGCHLWVSTRYCYIGPKLTSLSLQQPNSRSVNALPTLLLLLYLLLLLLLFCYPQFNSTHSLTHWLRIVM